MTARTGTAIAVCEAALEWACTDLDLGRDGVGVGDVERLALGRRVLKALGSVPDPDADALRVELALVRELHTSSDLDNIAQRRHYVDLIVHLRQHIANLQFALSALHGGDPTPAVVEAALRVDARVLERLTAERRPADEQFIGELIAQRIAARGAATRAANARRAARGRA